MKGDICNEKYGLVDSFNLDYLGDHWYDKDFIGIDKGIEVHDTYESAKGAFYAYMGAFAYGRAQDTNVNYVSCEITDMTGVRLIADTWNKAEASPAE